MKGSDEYEVGVDELKKNKTSGNNLQICMLLSKKMDTHDLKGFAFSTELETSRP